MTDTDAPTAQRIMDSAQRMVQQRGFHAFSYRDIAAEIGIRTASIHYHFPTKADLAGAVLDRVLSGFAGALRGFDRLELALDKLRHFCAVFLDTFDAGDRLCPFCMIATAQEGVSEALRGRVRHFWELGETWLARVLAEGAARGEFVLREQPLASARLIVAGLEGGMLVARAFDDRDRYVALADGLVAAVVPGGTKPPSVAMVQLGSTA